MMGTTEAADVTARHTARNAWHISLHEPGGYYSMPESILDTGVFHASSSSAPSRRHNIQFLGRTLVSSTTELLERHVMACSSTIMTGSVATLYHGFSRTATIIFPKESNNHLIGIRPPLVSDTPEMASCSRSVSSSVLCVRSSVNR